jgi:CO dehydrogenase nickel-insertion accessory protein CooC1
MKINMNVHGRAGEGKTMLTALIMKTLAENYCVISELSVKECDDGSEQVSFFLDFSNYMASIRST